MPTPSWLADQIPRGQMGTGRQQRPFCTRFCAAGCMQMGAGMRYIDVGGGLAVDYDGKLATRASRRTFLPTASHVNCSMPAVCY